MLTSSNKQIFLQNAKIFPNLFQRQTQTLKHFTTKLLYKCLKIYIILYKIFPNPSECSKIANIIFEVKLK